MPSNPASDSVERSVKMPRDLDVHVPSSPSTGESPAPAEGPRLTGLATTAATEVVSRGVARAVVPGTEGYAAEAAALIERYESVPFADKHRPVLDLIPAAPISVLDIGAGSGADAAWFARRGDRVLAVEPTDELRVAGMALHPSPMIEWADDSLPHLASTMRRRRTFDAVMVTAVWMHLDPAERALAMPNVASLIGRGGVLIMSLRHGLSSPRRRTFEVMAEETVELARAHGLRAILNVRAESAQLANRQAGVTWSRLAFRRSTPASKASER